jgi:BatD DUF11 like domain
MKAVVLAVLLISAYVGSAAAAEPRVRVAIDAKGPIIVGQQVRVDVTVLAPNFFLSPPQFPIFDLPGAIVTLPDENAINSTETIDGESYAGIRRSYMITPQQAGDVSLPPIRITFKYAAEPGKPGAEAAVTLPPETFTVTQPAGAQSSVSPGLVAKVVVTQTLDGDPKAMKVGDALARTVETFAPNTQAMMIPPCTFEARPGTRVYRHDPILSAVRSDRGDFLGGRRVDSATYVFDKPGTYLLPAIQVPWFDADKGTQKASAAPEITVSVREAPVPISDLAPPQAPTAEPDDQAWKRIFIRLVAYAAVGLAISWVWYEFGPRLRDRRRRRHEAWEASEAAAFERLRYACFAGDRFAAYKELASWARREGFASLRALCEREPTLRADVTELENDLFSNTHSRARWNGRHLFDRTAAVRTSRQRSRRSQRSAAVVLPALNP